jgi:hypothetical protein
MDLLFQEKKNQQKPKVLIMISKSIRIEKENQTIEDIELKYYIFL